MIQEYKQGDKMIDIERAKQEFKKYVNNYDKTQKKIKLKFSHSFRVMELSRKIAESLKLDNEQKDLATLIGLLHDVARFEQWKRFQTFSDRSSFDHGDVGVQILESDNFLRKFIEISKYDNTIKFAIKNHNKFKIEENNFNNETNMHAKIVRDADKLDIFFEAITIFWETQEEVNLIENSKISDEYFEQIMNKQQIFRSKDTTPLDAVICMISFIFDLNFDYSKKIVKKENYIQNILNKFDIKDEETKERVHKIQKLTDDYLINNF